MKKLLSTILCFATIVICTQLTLFAEPIYIVPRYSNILSEESSFVIDENGVASIVVSYSGTSTLTAKASITVKMQKRFLLFFWQDIAIGDHDGAWVAQTNTHSYANEINVHVSSGTYRVQIEYVITNVNGGVETINREYEYKY